MKIAFLGIRGIPATYSGFESFVEIFSRGLVKLGHDVTVYNRSTHIKERHFVYFGVKLIYLPTIANKFLDTFVHTFLSVCHCLVCKYDFIYVCGVGNALLTFLPRLFGKTVILNVDGLDWKREKWGWLAKHFLKTSEYLSTVLPSVTLTDSRFVQDYYLTSYNKEVYCIPYFSKFKKIDDCSGLEQFGVIPGKYILFVGRLVPENNAHQLIEAFKAIETDFKLVIVGDAPYSTKYIRKLKKDASANIVFAGYQFGHNYRLLSSNAFVFVLPGAAGGTRVVLLDQMAFGNCIVVNNSNNNVEVVGDAAYHYSGDTVSLRCALEYLLENYNDVCLLREKAKKRINEQYSFKKIMQQYNHLIAGLS